MTRKDYELLATALGLALAEGRKAGPAEQVGVITACLRVAWALERDNPRFNRERFIGWANKTSKEEENRHGKGTDTMPDITFEQFEEVLAVAREATLESLAANEHDGGEPFSPAAILAMFIAKAVDDLGTYY